MHKAALAFAVAVAPSVLLAQETYIQSITCEITKSCAANGNCVSDGTKVSFRMKTHSGRPADEGPTEIEYGGISTSLGGSTMSGTFFWSEGQDDIQLLQWLGSAGQDEEISYGTWTQIRPSLSGTVLFLTCRSDLE